MNLYLNNEMWFKRTDGSKDGVTTNDGASYDLVYINDIHYNAFSTDITVLFSSNNNVDLCCLFVNLIWNVQECGSGMDGIISNITNRVRDKLFIAGAICSTNQHCCYTNLTLFCSLTAMQNWNLQHFCYTIFFPCVPWLQSL